MLIAGIPVLMLILLSLAVGSDDDTPVYVTFIPAVVGVLAIVEAAPGWLYLDINRSSCVVTVLYLNAKLPSLIILGLGYDRLLKVSDPNGKLPTGLLLAGLQVVKIASGAVAVQEYLFAEYRTRTCPSLFLCAKYAMDVSESGLGKQKSSTDVPFGVYRESNFVRAGGLPKAPVQ